jgi:hypothetical protein
VDIQGGFTVCHVVFCAEETVGMMSDWRDSVGGNEGRTRPGDYVEAC